MKGVIVKMLSGFYYVKSGDSVYTCKARGIMRKNNITPLVGDYAEFTPDGNSGTVESIYERKNFLLRPPVANIEKAFIVSSFSTPKPNCYIIDTITAICEFKGIKPIIVFNKADLGDFTEYYNCYIGAGYKVIIVSAKNRTGFDELKTELKNAMSVFIGNSGVGKSSILNVFLPEAVETGEISEKLGRGRHTTRHTQFYPLEFGGYVADTPGFSEIEALKHDYSFKENLEYCFKEFENYISDCKFTGCTHTCEKGCAVIQAVNDGKIAKTRHNSYKMLYNDLKNLKKWQKQQ